MRSVLHVEICRSETMLYENSNLEVCPELLRKCLKSEICYILTWVRLDLELWQKLLLKSLNII